MNRFFVRNDAMYRLLRTIIQGIIGVLIANLDVIIGVFSWPVEVKAMIVALVMAILSPIMASMGRAEELPDAYWEETADKEINGRFGGDK